MYGLRRLATRRCALASAGSSPTASWRTTEARNVGKLAVARFLDKNTTEAVTKPEKAITYIDTKAWDTGSAGQFIDKPTLAVTQGTGTCTLGGRTIPASTVHLAWTVFVGNSDDVIRTKVYYARSSNCGASLDGPPTKLSEGYAVTQSASVAVAKTGAIFVVWRQFATAKGDPNQMLVAKSVDGGKSFTKGSPMPMASFVPFDQGTSSKTFRTNSFATTTTDQWGRLYVAFAVRGFASDIEQARVVVTSTMDGIIWTMPQAIENGASTLPGHQIMPPSAPSAEAECRLARFPRRRIGQVRQIHQGDLSAAPHDGCQRCPGDAEPGGHAAVDVVRHPSGFAPVPHSPANFAVISRVTTSVKRTAADPSSCSSIDRT